MQHVDLDWNPEVSKRILRIKGIFNLHFISLSFLIFDNSGVV